MKQIEDHIKASEYAGKYLSNYSVKLSVSQLNANFVFFNKCN